MQKSYLRDVAAFLSGCAVPLAFAPVSWFWVSIIALSLLFILCHNISAKRAWWRGYVFGIGMFGVGVSWISISFYQFSEVPLIVTFFITILFVLYLSLFPAFATWLLNRYFPIFSLPVVLLIMPSLWVLTEWVRGWLFTGFPWLLMGYSQIDTPLSGFAPVLGIYSLNWFVALTAGILAYLYVARKHWIVLSLVLIGVWGTGAYLKNIEWTQPIDEPIDTVLIQGNVPQALKWDEIDYSLRLYFKLTQRDLKADLIIWPETAMPLYYQDAKPFLARLQQARETYGTEFMTGIIVQQSENEYYNAILSLSHIETFYYKYHLVPFGEYIPLMKYFDKLLNFFDVPMSEFSRGAYKQQHLRAADQLIGASICYESAFSEQVLQSLPEATVLVNVSNDSWFGNSLAPHQHLEIARMRALETGRYLMRSTNTGISAIINPQGQITAQSPQFEVYNLRAPVQPYQGSTPYVQWGNKVILWAVFGLLFIGILLHRRLYTENRDSD
ncbi:apolipoprotein N-acyltransferase [Candidatus Albibeggiatoa sp. nov. NOAA]|uniref:apolipoprotein N-acyltransferase n=1 Tax=Candidatus Albibeggiatoa sp. nov. NOAA TaxID=3162724 RepID=UPI0032F6C96D|nr:apolipoprotein N-acyltransferase [Thiotrichaceae bacterium]